MSGRESDYSHVVKVVLLFVLALGSFIAIRWWFLPADFGVYGFYRAGALDDNRAHPLVHAGREACVDCHSDVVESRRGSRHAAIGCESCHGPLAAHASGADDAKPTLPDTRTTCVRCHTAKAGKPAGFPQVDVGEHAPEGACTTCHQPHHPGIS